MDSNQSCVTFALTDDSFTVCERGAVSVKKLLRRWRDGVAVAVQHGDGAGAAAEHIQEAALAVGNQVMVREGIQLQK